MSVGVTVSMVLTVVVRKAIVAIFDISRVAIGALGPGDVERIRLDVDKLCVRAGRDEPRTAVDLRVARFRRVAISDSLKVGGGGECCATVTCSRRVGGVEPSGHNRRIRSHSDAQEIARRNYQRDIRLVSTLAINY